MRRRERNTDGSQLKTLPRSESSGNLRHLRLASESTGAKAIGALAIGAFAIGALAIGAVAIGKLVIGRTRIRRLEVDELVVRKLRISDEVQLPGNLDLEDDVPAQPMDPSVRDEV